MTENITLYMNLSPTFEFEKESLHCTLIIVEVFSVLLYIRLFDCKHDFKSYPSRLGNIVNIDNLESKCLQKSYMNNIISISSYISLLLNHTKTFLDIKK